MNFIYQAIIVILILFITAQIARKFFKKDTTLYLFILLKTKGLKKTIKKISKYKFWDKLTTFGIVAGFGAFGIDYLIREKFTKSKRILLFILSSILFFIVYYVLLGNMLLTNPIISIYGSYIILIFCATMGLSGFTLGGLLVFSVDIFVKLFAGSTPCPGVGLVIPGVKMPKNPMFFPWYCWIILIISAFIHEMSHGAMLFRNKLKIKSVGVILAGILPLGAFVEPDEKEMKKEKPKNLVKMYSAGPTSNVIVAVFFLIILLLVSPPIQNYTNQIDQNIEEGLQIIAVDQNTDLCGNFFENPAYGKLLVNDQIISINGNEIKNRTDFTKYLNLETENEFVVKNTDTNLVRTEIIAKSNDLGRIGITVNSIIDEDYEIPKRYGFYKILKDVLFWTVLLNFVIASTNFLPTIPFDGGYMSQVIFSDYISKKNNQKKRMKKVAKFFGYLIIILIIANIVPYFI